MTSKLSNVSKEINNHLPDTQLELEELLGCSRTFFISFIKHLLKNKKFEEYDINHVKPLNSFKNKENAFRWSNVNLMLASENRSVKDIRDKESERKHDLKAKQYLEDTFLKMY